MLLRTCIYVCNLKSYFVKPFSFKMMFNADSNMIRNTEFDNNNDVTNFQIDGKNKNIV